MNTSNDFLLSLNDVEGSRLVFPKKSELTEDSDVHDELKKFIVEEGHPCVGAQAAFRKREYWLGVYPELAGEASSRMLAKDLYSFVLDQEANPTGYASFLAAFKSPIEMSEIEFEAALWNQLERLDRISSPFFEWDPSVSSNPADTKFSFSFGGKAFYIVGMHKNSSRMARSFSYPLIAINLHSQFEALRASGQYERLRDTVRKRDEELQGSKNPMLSDFGTESEARQYSGRKVDSSWKCPFHRSQSNHGV